MAATPGERDPQVLAKLRHDRIKASEEVIAKSLVGDYRAEHLFTLRQSLTAYRSYQKFIADCDDEIRQRLQAFQTPNEPTPPPIESGTKAEKTPSADGILRAELQRAFGVDLARVPGIRTGIAQTLFGEIGPDFSKFRSASALSSWMTICPDNDISGGKVLWAGTRKSKSRAAKALRIAAQSLHHSKSALGDFYRRMTARLGAPKAIIAAALKLARIIHHNHMVTTGQEYDESRFAEDQRRYQKRQEGKLGPRPKPWGSHSFASRRAEEFLRSICV
jgi:hypothetical protein